MNTQKESLLAAAREYFHLYGVDAFEMDGDRLTDAGTIALAQLAEEYREVGDTELDEQDAFAVIAQAFREAIGVE